MRGRKTDKIIILNAFAKSKSVILFKYGNMKASFFIFDARQR